MVKGKKTMFDRELFEKHFDNIMIDFCKKLSHVLHVEISHDNERNCLLMHKKLIYANKNKSEMFQYAIGLYQGIKLGQVKK